jgi:hypothetical protein
MRTLLLAVFAVACTTPDEDTPPVDIGPATHTLRLEFIEATGGAWLGGDRFAVVSPADNRVALVDFDSATVALLDGGSGSRELEHPAAIFALGDTLFVADWGKRRVTAWAGGRGLARVIPSSEIARGTLPQAIDGQGRLYYELAPPARRDGSGNRDSSAILRAAPDGGAADTVAQLAPLDIAEVASDQGRRFERRVFSGDDEWGVLPDGTIWVARTYQNRVDWISPGGQVTRGDQLSDRVLEVTRTDRERFVQRFPPELRNSAERLPFSPIKPPFVRAFTGADGHVWLEKSRWVMDTTQLYHEVGRDGNLIREVRVPGWGQILAVSPDAALVVTPDSTGFVVTRVPRPE